MKDQREMGPFAGFVLLDACRWDPDKFREDLNNDWGIPFPDGETQEQSEDGNSLVFDVGGMMAAVSLMPAPVPDGEAEHCAASNYFWPEAVEVTKTHKAHLLVAVLGHGQSALEIGKLYVKLCAACLKQEGALGVYTSGTVFHPGMYLDVADTMKADEAELPLFNWIYFGLYRTEQGMNAYTYGMTAFGKDELEVVGSKASPAELRDFLFDISYYILSEDVTLQDGETIGFSAEQKLPITRSAGLSVEGESLKIGFSGNPA